MSTLIRWLTLALVCLLAVAVAGVPARAAGMESAAALFKTKCTGCHTFGKGIRVGPDLKHVTDRHPRSWLIAWIQSSTKVIASGDPIAAALFRAFKEQRMPDHELSEAQIGALLDFLAADGPDADEQHRLRDATSASAADVDWGRRLFYGESQLKSGDLACVACHSVSRETALGGQLAGDLTNAYSRYHDKALDQVLKQPCMPRVPALQLARAEDRESLALRAFLRAVSAPTGSAPTGSATR
jgi:mono/diheme cytochrome c family protein